MRKKCCLVQIYLDDMLRKSRAGCCRVAYCHLFLFLNVWKLARGWNLVRTFWKFECFRSCLEGQKARVDIKKKSRTRSAFAQDHIGEKWNPFTEPSLTLISVSAHYRGLLSQHAAANTTIHHGDLGSSWGNFWLHPLTHLIRGGRGRRRIIEVWLQSLQRPQFINVSLPIKLSHLWFFLQIAVTPETEAKVRATEADGFLPLRAHFDSDLYLFSFFACFSFNR